MGEVASGVVQHRELAPASPGRASISYPHLLRCTTRACSTPLRAEKHRRKHLQHLGDKRARRIDETAAGMFSTAGTVTKGHCKVHTLVQIGPSTPMLVSESFPTTLKETVSCRNEFGLSAPR